MKAQKKSMKKEIGESFEKMRLIISTLLLAGVIYWDSKDIIYSIKFSLFIVGSFIIIWFLIYLYSMLKRNQFKIAILKSVDKEFLIAFAGSVLVYFFVSKYLLLTGILSIIFISISLLLIDILRNLNKKQ